MSGAGILRSNTVLNQVIENLWSHALQNTTVKAYRTGFVCFERFAAMHNLYSSVNSVFPVINEDVLIYFVAHCYHVLNLKYTTIKLYLAGIRFTYVKAGFANPLLSTNGSQLPRIQIILKSVKKLQGKPLKPRLPITFNILCKIIYTLRRGVFGPYLDVMMEAACTLAFFGFLRCGEFTKTTSYYDHKPFLTFGDIKFNNTESLDVTLRVSKTDPFRQGVTITIYKSNHIICPVRAMNHYFEIHRIRGFKYSGALFVKSDGKVITRIEFVDRVRQILRRLGLDEKCYSGHSFRGGAATSAAIARIEDHIIKTLGRWSSDCYTRYISTPKSAIREAQQSMAQTEFVK